MPDDIRLLNNILVCKVCWTDFHQQLSREDPCSIEYFTNGDGQGLLTKCKLCQEEGIRSRMHKLDSSSEDSWFCNLEHFYAYKAARDVEENPNRNLWIRVRHYTESTRNAGHSYDLNQSRIFRLAKIQLGESNQDLAEALEPQVNDQSNQNYSDEDISLIMRAPHIQLSTTEQEILDRILQESFDNSHPEFDHYKAIENLQRNFSNTVALCKSCFMPRHKTELEQYNEYCQECYNELYPEPEPEVIEETLTPIPEPELEPQVNSPINTNQSELIKLLEQQVEQQAQVIILLQTQAKTFERQAETINNLQARVDYLENFNRRIGNIYQEQSLQPSEQSSTSDNTSLNF